MTPFLGITKDNTLRPDTTLEKLATLKGVFGGSGTLTAGDSLALTDEFCGINGKRRMGERR